LGWLRYNIRMEHQTHHPRRISDILKSLLGEKSAADKTVADILDHLHERGFGFVLLLFALPAALPVPAIGIGTLMGIPLVILTVQIIIGRKTIWLPQSITEKLISHDTLEKFVSTAVPFLQKIEILIRPRLGFITQGVFSHIIGICGLIMALCVCLPFPLTNTIPSFGIAIMALGVASRDGLAVLAGITIGVAWVLLLVGTTLYFGAEAVDIIKTTIKGFMS
jgi:hypothetical protein